MGLYTNKNLVIENPVTVAELQKVASSQTRAKWHTGWLEHVDAAWMLPRQARGVEISSF